MPTEYFTVYKGEFCDDGGQDVFVEFRQRITYPSGSLPLIEVQDLIFSGHDSQPVSIDYDQKGEEGYKLTPINTSQCTVNIVADGDFELSNLYTQDEKEWMLVVTGAKQWSGFLLPDGASEPYDSKPYDLSVQATDALGTLEDVAYQNEDGTKIKGWFSDLAIIRQVLFKTGMSLKVLVGCSTFESTMNTAQSPLSQSFILAERFQDNSQQPFSCHEVLRSILARYSCRLRQYNGRWEITNTQELSQGSIKAWVYDESGNQIQVIDNIVNSLTVGSLQRTIQPTNGVSSIAKGFGQSTSYYQYGYLANSLINGDMDAWSSKPSGLPNDWVVVQREGSVYASTGIRQAYGVDTTDYFITVGGQGSGYLMNNNKVQVRLNEKVSVTMDLLVPVQSGLQFGGTFYLSILLYDEKGLYYTNTGWQNSFGLYVTKYDYKTALSQFNANFDVTPQPVDYQLTFGILPIGFANGLHFDTNVNNVKLSPTNDAAVKAGIGMFNRKTQSTKLTYKQDPILILNGDDTSDQRTSPIRVNNLPSNLWNRKGFTENKGILGIVSDTELRLHSRPYTLFEAEFNDFLGEITPNTLLTIDLQPGLFIFLSGTFDLKTNKHTLFFADAINQLPPIIELQAEDYGEKDDNIGNISQPNGVNNLPGSSYVDTSGFALKTDVPAAATNVETQAGTVINKYVSPSTLANWWSNLKTLAQTITGIWSVPTAATGTNTQQIASTAFVQSALLGLNPAYKEVSSNYTILNTDNTVNVTANTVTLTLPTAVGISGRIIRIKNSGTGTVTINTTGSQLIDGTLTKVINTQYSLFGLQSTGANWIIIAQM